MCSICEQEATRAADEHAEHLSSALKGHGRKAHGRDAGRKQKMSEDNRERDADEAWQRIYDQTYNRVSKVRHK